MKRVQYQLDLPNLSCAECLAQVEAGERGEGTHRPFPCQPCPTRRFGPFDEMSGLTLEVNRLLAGLSTGMGTPAFQFVYSLVGLTVPSPEATEVTERLILLWRIHRERAEEQEKRAPQNGQRPHESR